MAVITEHDKVGKFLTFKIDGHFVKQEVRPEDVVVSFPPNGFKKVTNIYYNPDTGNLVVAYKGS